VVHMLNIFMGNKNSKYYDYYNFCARQRQTKIPVKLTAREWLCWWMGTGKYDQRGRLDHEFCMARIDKTKDWDIDNIYCTTNKINRTRSRPIANRRPGGYRTR
jgi:hypothetical protein